MIVYPIIICVIFILIKVFEFYLEFINLKHLEKHGSEIPLGFEDVIDQDKLNKIKCYTIEKTRFGIISSCYDALILLIFIFSGLLGVYNSWILSFHMSFIPTGILFFLIIIFAHTLLQIPFDLYRSFRIEKKYGFNSLTLKLWFKDFIKSIIITTLLIVVLCAGALYVVSVSVNLWWLWVWILFFVFTIFMMYISPYVLEPLFNKFEPIQNESLLDSLQNLMKNVGIKISKVLKMDASKRTKHTNAYFSGIGNVKRIVLFDTMLEKMSHDEIISIVAHEAGHWKKKHIIKTIIMFEIISLVIFFFAYLLLRNDVILVLFNSAVPSVNNVLLLFPLKVFLLQFLLGIILFPISPVFHVFSRKNEKEADKFAVELTGTPKYMVNALVKLSADNLSNLHPHPFYSSFYYSHPSVLERIQYLKSLKDIP